MEEKLKDIPEKVSLRGRIVYGVMGSAAAAASLLAGSCVANCNGCMGCLAGGTGLLGVFAGTKVFERFTGGGRKMVRKLKQQGGIRHEKAGNRQIHID